MRQVNSIFVTGATGNVGRQVVNQLLAKGTRVRASSRNPDSAGFALDLQFEAAAGVTVLFGAKLATQLFPQLIPAGLLVTDPDSLLGLVTVIVGLLNVAVTVCAESIVTWQVPVPEQGPLQPAKLETPVGVAVRVTTVPTL